MTGAKKQSQHSCSKRIKAEVIQGISGVDQALQTVGMIGCVEIVMDKLMSHKVRISWCFLDEFVTEML